MLSRGEFALPSPFWGKPYSCLSEACQTSASSETQGRWKGLMSTRAGFQELARLQGLGGKRWGGKGMKLVVIRAASCLCDRSMS